MSDEDIVLLRKDIRAMKMQVIGQNMSLSDPEAEKFWPIYKHYADDLHEVNNSKYALLKEYAETWATMSDQDALIYVRHWMEVDAEAQAAGFGLGVVDGVEHGGGEEGEVLEVFCGVVEDFGVDEG